MHIPDDSDPGRLTREVKNLMGITAQIRTPWGTPDERRRARVLHVENNKYVFRAVKRVMTLYEVAAIHNVHCPDQAAAIKVLESNRHFDLIITDHSPPTVDGAEVIRVVRSLPHRKDVPVLMLASTLDYLAPPEAAGADAFFSKPPDFDEFKRTVERLLSRNAPPAEDPCMSGILRDYNAWVVILVNLTPASITGGLPMTQKVGKATKVTRPAQGKGKKGEISSAESRAEQETPQSSAATGTEIERLFEIEGLLKIAELISGIKKEGRL